MEHCTTIQQLGEGGVQAVCSCGWRSPVFGSGQGNRHDGPAAARGRSCRSARVGDVPAVSGTEAGPGRRRDARQADSGIPAATSRSPGYLAPGSPVLLAISRRKPRPPYPDHIIDGVNAAVLAAAPGSRCPAARAAQRLDRPRAGTGGLIVGTHRGRARAGPVIRRRLRRAGRARPVARTEVRQAASGVRMGTGTRTARPAGWPAPAGRRPERSPARCAWPVSSMLPLTGSGGTTVNGSSQGNPSPLTVTSPDLAGGTFPREFTCDGANRLPRLQWSTPPSGTQEVAIEMLDPDAPGGTFTHWLAYRVAPWHHQPGGRAGRRGRRRQRLRPARLRGPVPAARRCASLPLRGPRAGHPAGPGSRSEEVGSGLTHPRSRAGQGRTGRHLPARLSSPCQRSKPDSASRSEIPALAQTLITECSQPAEGKRVYPPLSQVRFGVSLT